MIRVDGGDVTSLSTFEGGFGDFDIYSINAKPLVFIGAHIHTLV